MAAPDRPGLLASVAGVLTLCGVTIRSANAMSDASTDMALLQFQVTPTFDELPDWDRVRADIAAALDGRLALPARLEERERHYARYRRASAAAAPQARVTIDNSASATSTVVEVRAPDRGPVLYQVAGALADRGLTITAALDQHPRGRSHRRVLCADGRRRPGHRCRGTAATGGDGRGRPVRPVRTARLAGDSRLLVQPGVLAPQPHGNGEPSSCDY